MKTLRDIPNLRGVRVFLRADFNVPIKGGKVADDFRIRAALPTIDYLRSRGARLVIGSHIEVQEGEEATLKPVVPILEKLGIPVEFAEDYKSAFALSRSMENGACVLLENLRSWKGEKADEEAFARQLAALADIYVNDAFPVCHRKHASIVGIPKLLPSYAGAQLEKEVANLSKAFDPSHPFLFILGGAKFETKIPLIERFLSTADAVFLGGALANDVLKAKGLEVGLSTVSEREYDLGSLLRSPKLIVPTDVIDENRKARPADKVGKQDRIFDAGPETVKLIIQRAMEARFILWNGPLGMYEQGYTGPTLEIAKALAGATARGAITIIGGGDTVAAISSLKLEKSFTFVSTGGGAMLDFLAQGTLPGIEALG